jgi:hypothetical protein
MLRVWRIDRRMVVLASQRETLALRDNASAIDGVSVISFATERCV